LIEIELLQKNEHGPIGRTQRPIGGLAAGVIFIAKLGDPMHPVRSIESQGVLRIA
jgi:hypothetical protein